MFNLKNKRIAVYGMGVSGLSAVRLIKELEGEIIAINGGDLNQWCKSPGVLDYVKRECCFSESDPELHTQLNNVDLVILSPGIPRDHKLLEPLHKKNIPVWGEIELAYRYLESHSLLSPMIGITGTNGKTTTTTFLGEMIKASDKKVFVGGNIGIPFCDYAFSLFKGQDKADFILLELSSFQLESIDHFHVDIAIILNLYQNHGERYATIEEYGRSKFFITNRFTKNDTLIYPEDFSLIKNWAITQEGKKIAIDTTKPVIRYDVLDYKLPGIHNLVNLAFIIEAAECIRLSKEAIQKTINNFGGVHHRIEYIDGVVGLSGFRVFNDAKSTNWDATITAIKAMEDYKLPIHLIIGGKKRGHGDSILPHLDFIKKKVAHLYLIGEMSSEIENEIRGQMSYQKCLTLKATVDYVRENFALEKGVLLFSPGFPSFDQFQNYAERGDTFIRIMRESLAD